MELNIKIKEETFSAHQKTEGIVVRKIKTINSEADYIQILRSFYAYFNAIEKATAPYINETILPDLKQRRDSSYIQRDIEALGGNIENLSPVKTPEIHDILDALAAMYVLEGSIMGGPYIVKMLEKRNIDKGVSFFQGYGRESGEMWAKFITILNEHGTGSSTHQRAIDIANQTFMNFGEVF